MALGATPIDVLVLVIREGMHMPLIGIALGLGASAGLTRVMSHLLYGVTPTDTATFATVPVVFAFAAMIACYVAARRTASVDPVDALRHL